jgi:sporulation protein YlmC with PRC-barrel domain
MPKDRAYVYAFDYGVINGKGGLLSTRGNAKCPERENRQIGKWKILMEEMMMYRYLMITVALIGAVGLAHAQHPTTGSAPSLVEVEKEAMMVERFNLSVKQLADMELTDSGGKRIGEVEEVLMTPEGKITAVSVEVAGDKEVVMKLDQLRRQGDVLMTDLTEEQVEALPSWPD